MAKKKPRIINQNALLSAIKKLPNPITDSKHNLKIYIDEGRARSNQTRVEHIIDCSHDLKVRDVESIPDGIQSYFAYKKDPVYKNTFNYYLKRKGKDRGLIKVSIQIDHKDQNKAWIKTIFIAYHIK